ncbi:GroES-like protein [Calocera cornea HHB12733]|uniref:GroES-like protein n=1 Tax=Calocera cornea HHB12733 TaxID=1353952 RepID=A0A165CI20_9BASI|nr:GroES-like protein [Calocera cornea HHB12733]
MSTNLNLAIVVPGKGASPLAPARPVDLPVPGEGELLVKVEAAGQNPVDTMQAAVGYIVPSFPIIVGVDCAGSVVSLGPGVSSFAPGDRIAAYTPLGQASQYGAYQQYCLARAAAAIHLPASLSYDSAATLPLAFYTAAIGLHLLLGVPVPLDEAGTLAPDVGADEWILVWGASSSVGAAAVQLAKAAGFHVVATASPANFAYVQTLGADVVLDYHDPAIVDSIQSTASLSLAFDAISQPPTTTACLAALSSEGGKIAITLPYAGAVPDSVELLGVNASALHSRMLHDVPELTRLWQALINEGKLRPHPFKIMPHGLNSIDAGFALQREGKISAQKLVYHPQETQA